MIERYDRAIDEHGSIVRLHQEDFCQALHLPPEIKYQKEGGPSLAQLFDLIDKRIAIGTMSGHNKVLLLRGVIFNFLIGNGDAHGKNCSLLYQQDEEQLAPFYDLMCTVVYSNFFKAKMAMKLAGRYKFSNVTITQFETLAQQLGFKPNFVNNEIQKLVHKISIAAPTLARELNASTCTKSAMHQQICDVISRHCALLD